MFVGLISRCRCIFRYLNIVEQLPMYGVHYYNVKTKVMSDLHGKFKMSDKQVVQQLNKCAGHFALTKLSLLSDCMFSQLPFCRMVSYYCKVATFRVCSK